MSENNIEISDLQETLTVLQVANICQVSRVTVTRWIGRGLLRAIRPPTGGALKIRKEDFEEFVGRYKFTTTKEGADE
jgi:excisionase family DNA binding protein